MARRMLGGSGAAGGRGRRLSGSCLPRVARCPSLLPYPMYRSTAAVLPLNIEHARGCLVLVCSRQEHHFKKTLMKECLAFGFHPSSLVSHSLRDKG